MTSSYYILVKKYHNKTAAQRVVLHKMMTDAFAAEDFVLKYPVLHVCFVRTDDYFSAQKDFPCTIFGSYSVRRVSQHNMQP